MNSISDYKKCSNCGACYNICPVDAIKISDKDIFYTVDVDEKKCIECGLCKKVCPVNVVEENENVISAYGGAYKNKDIINKSSSGGAFTAIAEKIISMGGVVYGACYENNCKEVVFKSSEETDISRMRKSKYVESRVNMTFREIRDKLSQGITVLFAGAPCQVAGLKRFLKKDYENLYTCDFICGGLPSHHMYRDYIEGLEKKYKSRAVNVDFRSKIVGWDSYYIKIDFENGRTYESDMTIDPYFYAFVGKYFSMRDYCYECVFCKNHYSDIILADFWRYKELSSFPYNNEGLSMMLVNTEKGNYLVNSITDIFDMEKLDTEGAKAQLREPCHSKEHLEKREEFIDFYKEKGIFKSAKVFYKPPIKKVVKKKAKAILKKLKENR